MNTFVAQRLIRMASIRLLAAPERVFPLFEPLGEREWATDWEPVLLYPTSGAAEEQAVFLTPHLHSTTPAIWTITRFAPQDYEIRYLRVAPNEHVAEISITCVELDDGQTQASIAYVFTGLSAEGNLYVSTFSEEHYLHWIHSWETAINHYLQFGRRYQHAGHSEIEKG